MENTFTMLKNARQAIIEKMTEQENRINGGSIRILEASLADDFSDFSKVEEEAYMVWQVYSEALLALQKADERLANAVEIEAESNIFVNKINTICK